MGTAGQNANYYRRKDPRQKNRKGWMLPFRSPRSLSKLRRRKR